MKQFPRRQVHLDFHTSPDIPGIGSRFDKAQFQAALKAGHLESITVFAKCHHGYCYYPTEVGTVHPGLEDGFDFTGAMVEAAHEIGVRAPIYITAGWCELDATTHPEWIVKTANGEYHSTAPRKKIRVDGPDAPMGNCSWDYLCLNDGSYCQHIYEITEEVCKRYKDVDGLFYDICMAGDSCYCDECVKGMREMGLDPENEADAKRYYIIKRQAFQKKCGDIMRKYHPNGTIFFNGGGANIDKTPYHQFHTHFEMEDLPTAWGGYDALPVRAKYFSRSGKPYIGMTGKFHLNWGEFGGFKCKEALKYEVAAMALYGAGCSVGDHMHPDGEMEMQTYENVGYAYAYQEKIAPFCFGGEPTAKLGLVMAKKKPIMEKLSKILMENQMDYEIVFNNDFSAFDTVIVPEQEKLDEEGLAALKQFVANGGKVMFYGTALVKDGAFLLDCGAEYLGEPNFDSDYLICDTPNDLELPDAPMLCMVPAQRIRVTDGQVLAHTLQPYFSRTGAHFCGHRNTPHNKNGEQLPAIVRKGNVVYMAHNMPELYGKEGSLYHKRYFMLALKQLYSGVLTVRGLGSEGRATMIHQPEQNRYCVNMVYASPSKRGEAYIIEDILPIYNIELTLDVPEKIKKAYLGLSGEVLAVTEENGKQKVLVPKLECHASVVLDY